MNCKLLSIPALALGALLTAQQPDANQGPTGQEPAAHGPVKGPATQEPGKQGPGKQEPGKQGPGSVVAPVGPAGESAGRGGNSWFPVTDKDLGTYFNHESAVGKFAFSNPKDASVVWKHLAGSCQCSKAVINVGDRRYELTKGTGPNPLVRVMLDGVKEDPTPVTQIEIGPHESGEIEVHMVMNGITGPRQATLDIHTDDPDLPMMKLKWTAVGAKMFVLSPNEVSLNEMVWNEKREFTVTVTSPVAKDFEITRMDDPGEDFEVRYEKELNNGLATWTISGSYSPTSAEALGGGVLKFYTDLEGEASFLVRVSAMVKGPLEVKPGTFLTLGMIRKGQSKSASVTFVANDGTELEAKAIRFERLSVDPKFLTTSQERNGKELVVTLEISKDAPSGLLRGDMIVELNHQAVPHKTILFNGYVR